MELADDSPPSACSGELATTRPPNCQGHSAMIGPRASAPPASQHPAAGANLTSLATRLARECPLSSNLSSSTDNHVSSGPGHDPMRCPNHCAGDVQLWSYAACVSLCMTVYSTQYHIYHTLANISGSPPCWCELTPTLVPICMRTRTQLPCLTPAHPQLGRVSRPCRRSRRGPRAGTTVAGDMPLYGYMYRNRAPIFSGAPSGHLAPFIPPHELHPPEEPVSKP
jgi:hypothetical protein